MSDQGPYGHSADVYWKKAWLPFPVKGKHEAIPKGITGLAGTDPTWAQIQEWTAKRPFFNVAVRANGWISIDVDAGGAAAIFKATAELGLLPDTYSSTSWGPDSERKQWFYRVPLNFSVRLAEGRFNKRFGPHVDIIHRGHRYSIVAPSKHPDTGNAYAWYGPDGQPSQVPTRTELPELPPSWLAFLAEGGQSEPAGERSLAGLKTPDDFYEDAPSDGGPWSMQGARAEIERMLDRIRTVDSNINTQAGGAMREVGRFVPAVLTEEEAVAACMEALGPTASEGNSAHSDSWNVANGKDWTAATLAAMAVARGMEEPHEVRAESGGGQGVGGGPERAGGVMPAPSDPMAVARELEARMTKPRKWWRGDFYQHSGTRWDVAEDSTVVRWLYRMTENATFITPDGKGDDQVKRWAPTKKKIGDLAHALGVGVLQHAGEAEVCLAVRNGVLIPGTRELIPHTPERFNLTALPFDYDPEATCPSWHDFLEQVLPGDQQAKDFLAEWFGYVLSGRTNQQKMAAFIGKRRSGKGTVARVLTAVLGQEAVAGLDLNLVSGTFGLEHLIGKSLAISGDVRWHSRNVADAVPVLLGVIGEDSMPVHRKNRSTWTGRLGVRFTLMSNETPTFSDRSGALGGRMIYVKFDQSFYGREDISLTEKLLEELPGVLNWALDGLERLDGRRRFTEPVSGQAEADAVRRLSDPMGAFLEDWCVVGEGNEITLDHLYLKYRSWCESEGRVRDSTTKEIFSRDLRSKVAGLNSKRPRIGGKQVTMLYGIGCEVI